MNEGSEVRVHWVAKTQKHGGTEIQNLTLATQSAAELFVYTTYENLTFDLPKNNCWH